MSSKTDASRDPAQRLVLSTIEEIESRGIAQVTVRGIAARAGVNIAAVNYYFRSKEALIAEAKELAIRHLVQDASQMLEPISASPEAGLATFLEYLLEGTRKYPRMTRAQLHDAFVADDYSGPFPRLFAPILERLRDALTAAVPALDPGQAGRRVMAALSAVLFPSFFPGLFAPLRPLDIEEDRRAYCREIARSALAASGAGKPPRAQRRRARDRR